MAAQLSCANMAAQVERLRSDVGEIWNPSDVTFLPDAMVAVAEYDNMSNKNNRVHVFDSSGKSLLVCVCGKVC